MQRQTCRTNCDGCAAAFVDEDSRVGLEGRFGLSNLEAAPLEAMPSKEPLETSALLSSGCCCMADIAMMRRQNIDQVRSLELLNRPALDLTKATRVCCWLTVR